MNLFLVQFHLGNSSLPHAPLPVEIANNAYHRLLTLVASLDLHGDAERRLADINRVATRELWQ